MKEPEECSACKKRGPVHPNPGYIDEFLCWDCLEEEEQAAMLRAHQLDMEEGRFGYEKDFFRE
jgi:hypothetical protein